MSTDGFVFEEDSTFRFESLFQNLTDIDDEIRRIRYDNSIKRDDKIDQIIELFNKRNEAYDKIQSLKSKEFNDFLSSLNLADMNLTPFHPIPTRCKFIVQDEEIASIIEKGEPAATSPWQKMLKNFMKNKKEKKEKKETKEKKDKKEKKE